MAEEEGTVLSEDIKEEKNVQDEGVKKEEEKKEEAKDKNLSPETKDEGSEADESKDEGAPETYTDFTLSEGVEADKETMDEFKTLAKEENWSQEKAQKLVDLQNKAMIRAGDTLKQRWNDTQKEWRESTENDKAFGGDKLNESLVFAKSAIKKFGNDAFSEMLESTGMGNHPEVVRFLYKIGKSISEDDIMAGRAAASGPKDPAKVLFPDMK